MPNPDPFELYNRLLRSQQSRFARILDLIGSRLFLWAITALILYSRLGKLLPSFLLALLWTALISWLIHFIKVRQRKNQFEKFIKAESEKYFLDEILLLSPKALLHRLHRDLMEMKIFDFLDERDHHLFAVKDGKTYAVVFLPASASRPVDERDILSFYRKAKSLGVKGLVIYTTGTFHEDAKRLRALIKDVSVHFRDGGVLLQIMGLAKESLPESALIELLEDKLHAVEVHPPEQLPWTQPKAIKRMLVFGGVLMLLSFYVPYGTYYRVVGLLLLGLGAFGLFKGFVAEATLSKKSL